MSNPNPSPHTRFRPGQSGNPSGRKSGSLNEKTVLGGVRQVCPLDEVLADERSSKGSYPQLLESVLRDEQHPLDVRLSCANALMRGGAGDKPQQQQVDLSHMTSRLSNSMDVSFCLSAPEEALARFGKPDIFNTDQGSQFTSAAFTGVLLAAGIKVSMDGRGR